MFSKIRKTIEPTGKGDNTPASEQYETYRARYRRSRAAAFPEGPAAEANFRRMASSRIGALAWSKDQSSPTMRRSDPAGRACLRSRISFDLRDGSSVPVGTSDGGRGSQGSGDGEGPREEHSGPLRARWACVRAAKYGGHSGWNAASTHVETPGGSAPGGIENASRML